MNNDIKDSGLWTEVKTETGFILNVNLRRDTLDECMKDLKTFILANKCQPYERYSKSASTFATKPSGGMCSKHQVEMKLNKNGKPYHSKGTYPDLTYCNGRGFPEDFEGQSSEEIGASL